MAKNYNLTNQSISSSFDQLLQKNDTTGYLVNGTGSVVEGLIISGTISGSFFVGDGSGLTNLPIVTSSLPSGVVSGSSQIILQDTTGDLSGSRIDGAVASSSFSSTTLWTGIIGTPSGLVSGSVQISDITGSSLVTASNDFSEITFTKGDASTFLLDTTPRIVYETVKNKNGAMIKGTPVYVSGSTGNASNVYLADASDPTKMPATYILNQDLDPEEEGFGLLIGFINGVNTSGFNAGDSIYVAVGGGYTNQKPTGSALIQKLGNVIKVDGSNGSGVIYGSGRANDVPNITEGYFWVGDGDGVAQPTPTSSISVTIDTGSFATTGSNTFIGDQIVSGNLEVSGTIQSSLYLNPITLTGSLSVPSGSNGMVVGPVNNAGTISVASGSTLLILSEATGSGGGTIDTGSFATTGSNAFNGTQIITGGLDVDASTNDINLKTSTGEIYLNNNVGDGDLRIGYVSGSFPGLSQNSLTINADTVINNQLQFNEARFQNGQGTQGTFATFAKDNPNQLRLNMHWSGTPASGSTWQVVVATGSYSSQAFISAFDNEEARIEMQTGFGGTLNQIQIQATTVDISGSEDIDMITPKVNISEVVNLAPQDPLPTGAVGDMAASGSNLYFHNGTQWKEVSFV